MPRTKKSNPSPEHDIFHSEPAPGAVVHDLTGMIFTLTFSHNYKETRRTCPKILSKAFIKFNRPLENGDNYVRGFIVLPICKGKDK